jgi:hypothetical protein
VPGGAGVPLDGTLAGLKLVGFSLWALAASILLAQPRRERRDLGAAEGRIQFLVGVGRPRRECGEQREEEPDLPPVLRKKLSHLTRAPPVPPASAPAPLEALGRSRPRALPTV